MRAASPDEPGCDLAAIQITHCNAQFCACASTTLPNTVVSGWSSAACSLAGLRAFRPSGGDGRTIREHAAGGPGRVTPDAPGASPFHPVLAISAAGRILLQRQAGFWPPYISAYTFLTMCRHNLRTYLHG